MLNNHLAIAVLGILLVTGCFSSSCLNSERDTAHGGCPQEALVENQYQDINKSSVDGYYFPDIPIIYPKSCIAHPLPIKSPSGTLKNSNEFEEFRLKANRTATLSVVSGTFTGKINRNRDTGNFEIFLTEADDLAIVDMPEELIDYLEAFAAE